MVQRQNPRSQQGVSVHVLLGVVPALGTTRQGNPGHFPALPVASDTPGHLLVLCGSRDASYRSVRLGELGLLRRGEDFWSSWRGDEAAGSDSRGAQPVVTKGSQSPEGDGCPFSQEPATWALPNTLERPCWAPAVEQQCPHPTVLLYARALPPPRCFRMSLSIHAPSWEQATAW